MKIICSGRRSGKTTKIIMESARTGHYILVSNKTQARYTFKMARDMDLNIPFPITIEELMIYGVDVTVRRQGILVDEGQHILEKVLDSKINVMTINTEVTDDEVHDKAIKQIRSAATDYNVGVIEAESAMIRVMGTLAELDRKVNEIVEKVQK